MILLSITNLVRVKWLNLILCLPGARLVELVTSVSVTGILAAGLVRSCLVADELV